MLTPFRALAGSKRLLALATLTAISLLGAAPGSNAQSEIRVLPRGIDQLTNEAKVIVHGYVTSIKIEPHPQLQNLMTLVVSLNVKEVYKGRPQASLVFRQYVWDLDRSPKALEYRTGDEVVLLLGPVSAYGLSSPVGLEQGLFRVSRNNQGRLVALNGRRNLGLFDHVAERARARGMQLPAPTGALANQHREGPVLLTDLKDAILTFARAH